MPSVTQCIQQRDKGNVMKREFCELRCKELAIIKLHQSTAQWCFVPFLKWKSQPHIDRLLK